MEKMDGVQHDVTLKGRNALSANGVLKVERFDDHVAVLETTQGVLVVEGENLHLGMLSLEGGQVTVDGQIDSLVYQPEGSVGGFFSRLFG